MTEAKLLYRLPKPMDLGEGIIYRAKDQTLHYNDCLADPPQLHILELGPEGRALKPSQVEVSQRSSENATADGLRVLNLKDSVTVQLFRKNKPGSYICLYYQGIAFLDEQTGELDVLKELIPTQDKDKRRMNDGAIGPYGSLYAGEIDIHALSLGSGNIPADYKPIGRLWRYDPDGSVHLVDQEIVCANGMAWTMDKSIMFFNDSAGQKIWKYSYSSTGEMSNKTLLKDYAGTPFEPDGMCADTCDNIWFALYGASSVFQMDKAGQVLREIKVPAFAVTCPTFGGPDNSYLYVTSGYTEGEDDSGQVYLIEDTRVRGQDKYEFAG